MQFICELHIKERNMHQLTSYNIFFSIYSIIVTRSSIISPINKVKITTKIFDVALFSEFRSITVINIFVQHFNSNNRACVCVQTHYRTCFMCL